MSDEPIIRYDWFLLESWPGMMLTAKVEIIGRLGANQFFLPMTWRRAKVDGRDQPVCAPRLPGNYAFVQLPSEPGNRTNEVLNDQAATLTSLRGVRQIFKNSSRHYATVPNWEIRALMDAEALEHREAGKAHPKHTEPRFKAGAQVRILRRHTLEGQTGEFLYSVRGQATLAMENGIKLPIPECDLAEVVAQRTKLAG